MGGRPASPAREPLHRSPSTRKEGERAARLRIGVGATPARGSSLEISSLLAAILGPPGRGPPPHGVSDWQAPGSQGPAVPGQGLTGGIWGLTSTDELGAAVPETLAGGGAAGPLAGQGLVTAGQSPSWGDTDVSQGDMESLPRGGSTCPENPHMAVNSKQESSRGHPRGPVSPIAFHKHPKCVHREY